MQCAEYSTIASVPKKAQARLRTAYLASFKRKLVFSSLFCCRIYGN